MHMTKIIPLDTNRDASGLSFAMTSTGNPIPATMSVPMTALPMCCDSANSVAKKRLFHASYSAKSTTPIFSAVRGAMNATDSSHTQDPYVSIGCSNLSVWTTNISYWGALMTVIDASNTRLAAGKGMKTMNVRKTFLKTRFVQQHFVPDIIIPTGTNVDFRDTVIRL
mmetsp:Transcript_6407/g.16253  ORF Transcript_6407/g.16253 Transcript_6407/m.16253 type:complete len:167 (+) Transcript_6407:2480-2980(+)